MAEPGRLRKPVGFLFLGWGGNGVKMIVLITGRINTRSRGLVKWLFANQIKISDFLKGWPSVRLGGWGGRGPAIA